MKNKTASFITIVVATLSSHLGFGQWTELNTTPNDHAQKYCFVSDDIGYALMNNGTDIKKTANGGNSWSTIPVPVASQEYMDFSFPAEGIGFAVYRDISGGANPMKIYSTTNDGISWQDISPDTTNTGFGNSFLDFIDGNTGFWLVGDVLYRTTNAGIDWDTTNLGPPSAYLNAQSVDFFDANNGVIGFHDGTFNYFGGMLVTTDGGVTFNRTNLTTYYSVIGAVDQASASTTYAASAGWGSNNLMKLYRSTNGGVSWDTLNISVSIPNAELLLFDFIDPQKGVIVVYSSGNGVYMYNTIDGGLSWTFDDSINVAYASDIELTANTGYYSGYTNQFFKWTGSFAVGIDSPIQENKNQMVLYPNPMVSGSVLTWNSEMDYTHLTILDIFGREVFKANHIDQRIMISALQAGTYLVKLSNSTVEHTSTLIIQ